MPMPNGNLQSKLDLYKAANLYRVRRQSTVNEELVNFSSNDYLGLTKHPELIKSFQNAAKKYGIGSGASQLVTGHYDAHRECEDAFAEFLQRDRALLFGNGYMANLGVIDTLTEAGDEIYQDRNNHASLLDGARFSKAKSQRYWHNDIENLKIRIEKSTTLNRFIISDGVFSMGGDIAHIPQLAKLSKQYRATLMIDDAHGIGVLGTNGGGSLEQFGMTQKDVSVLVCPLGKAFASYGAIVAGSHELIESLIQFARSYIYTTAIPPALAIANIKSLALVQRESWRREKLKALVTFFQEKAKERDIHLLTSPTPIQPILIGDPEQAIMISEQLLEKGFLVSALRPPTVPKDQSILRVTLNASHTESQIIALLDLIKMSQQARPTFDYAR